jgi:pre-peptidase
MNRRIALWSVASAFVLVSAARVPFARSVEPGLLVADISVTEPDTGIATAILTVSLPTPVLAHGDILVPYATHAETATEGTACALGVDFIGPHSATVTIGARQKSASIAVQVCGDIRFEPNETFTVEVLNPTRTAVLAKARVTIIDNDPAPVRWTGLSAGGTIAKAEEQRWQTPNVQAGTYMFTMSNLSGDADLYVRVGAPPTTTAFTCRPARASADETCQITLNVPDVIYVAVRGYATSSQFALVGSVR